MSKFQLYVENELVVETDSHGEVRRFLDKFRGEPKNVKRRVVCRETGEEFDSIRAAERKLGVNNVGAQLNGKLKAVGRSVEGGPFTFSYVSGEDNSENGLGLRGRGEEEGPGENFRSPEKIFKPRPENTQTDTQETKKYGDPILDKLIKKAKEDIPEPPKPSKYRKVKEKEPEVVTIPGPKF